MTFQPKKTVKTDLSDLVLRKGESCSFRFSGEDLTRDEHHRLYFTCEDRMHYALKDEPQTERLYMLIDDSLDTEHNNTRRFCLNLSCKAPYPFAKRAAVKIQWPPKLAAVMLGATEEWELGIHAMAKDLVIEKDGYLRICLERWAKRPGVNPLLTREAPDDTHVIDIPGGTYDYTFFSKLVNIPTSSTACVLITVEGERYSGEIYVEEPTLRTKAGKNACPDFDLSVPNLDYFTWVGQSLSKKEWPEFVISINGREIHNGEVFLRVHRYPSVELEIPDDLIFENENEITFKYVSNYHDTVPLSLREVMILSRPKKLFSITYCPHTAAIGEDLCVLIRTEEEGLTLKCESEDFEPVSDLYFADTGIHAARFIIKNPANHKCLTLSCRGITDTAEIVHMAERGDDGIICGSGDMIYIDTNHRTPVEDYLEWFLEKEMGDLVTVRPCYRWSSHRSLNAEAWKKFTEICNGMDIKYAHMVDGRDLPAIPYNPSLKMMEGKHFLGRQVHERDGQAFYWNYPAFQYIPISPTFWDISQRISRQMPDTVEEAYGAGNIIMVDRGRGALYHNIDCDADMRSAHESAMDTLNVCRGSSTRHTGPSVMFKYFLEAGYDWVGAETMDSTMESLLAFLRGAAKAYGKNDIGVHHAVQWSTVPHDTEPRYRRFLLALYTSYMQGVYQINTEEGFWHLENGYHNHHRFSEACEKHREQEVHLTRFVRSHTRSGKYYTPIAILHGRYDGWNGFIGQRLWGMPHMLSGEAERSWELLKVFYPLDTINQTGMCVTGSRPGEKDDKPRGMYSGTPRGNVDVVPVEKGDYSDYKLLAFLSYNAADPADFDRLGEYVKNGGMLMCAWPHLSTVTKVADIQARNHFYLYHPIVSALTSGAPVFESRTLGGKKLDVCVTVPKDAEVLETTDDGTPLVYSVSYGKGKLILVNTKLYPANEIIRPIYEKLLSDIQSKLAAEEPDEMLCGTDVQYTVYTQDDGSRHYYVTPVDWYNQPDFKRHAQLRIGKESYGMDLDFGVMLKIVANDGVAAYAEEETAEVISADSRSIRVQGVDTVTVHIFKNGEEKIFTVDCNEQPMHTVEI